MLTPGAIRSGYNIKEVKLATNIVKVIDMNLICSVIANKP
jgi:hypothetical protein